MGGREGGGGYIEGGRLTKKGGGTWTVCWFKGGLGQKEGGGVFEGGGGEGGGGWDPNAHYDSNLPDNAKY